MGAGGSTALKRCVNNLTADELRVVEERFVALKSEGVSGADLVNKMCEEIDARNAERRAAEAAAAPPDTAPLAEARARVKSLNDAVSMEAFSNFLVGIDGAKPSDLALEVCLYELMKSRDNIMVLHASDPHRSNFFSPSLKSENVKERTQTMLSQILPEKRFKLMWVEKKDDERMKGCILRTVNDLTSTRNNLLASERPSYFVTGLTGRRGENAVGKLVLLAVKNFHIPNIVIKMPPVLNEPRTFVAAVKHLDRMEPIHIAMDLMKPGKGDKLIVVHIYSGELEPEAVKDYSKLFLNIVSTEGYERSGSLFLPVRDSGAKTWREEIVDFIATHRAHYLLMNPAIAIGDELQENETMENCKQIIQQVNCNVVICNH